MITVELKYPLNDEVKEFEIPLPKLVIDSGDYLVLLFNDDKDYYAYIEILCDLTDDLYYQAIKTQEREDKLTCLRTLMSLLTK